MPYKVIAPCVGGKHHSFHAAVQDNILKIGTPVILEREPTNPYDENAIKVLVNVLEDIPDSPTLQIGYIAKNFAIHLAPLMDSNKRFRAKCMLVRDNSCSVEIEEVESE